tara:strand:+ start:72 stop:359 length:288 start_codon:yes stop_codon:yes gene_type:complete
MSFLGTLVGTFLAIITDPIGFVLLLILNYINTSKVMLVSSGIVVAILSEALMSNLRYYHEFGDGIILRVIGYIFLAFVCQILIKFLKSKFKKKTD